MKNKYRIKVIKEVIKRVLVRVSIISAFFSAVLLMQYHHLPDPPSSSRFVKIDANGQAMKPWHGPWACTLDQTTGLIWENKTDDESIHDGLWTYSWFDMSLDKGGQKGVQNAGDCYFESSRCDTSDLIRRANNQGRCGIKNWRLPTEQELLSIVNSQPKTGMAKIYNEYFSYTKRGDYWTAEHNIVLTGVYAHLKYGALAINFIDGQPTALPYRNAAFVRLVAKQNQAVQQLGN